MKFKPIRCMTSLLLILLFASMSSAVNFVGRAAAEPILVTAKGKGTMKVGSETFQVTSVVVKLAEDGTAELTLVAEITFFLSGKWTVDSASPKNYNLQITGSITGGGAQGTGKIVMQDDGKSLDRLSAQGGLKTSTRKVAIEFVADR